LALGYGGSKAKGDPLAEAQGRGERHIEMAASPWLRGPVRGLVSAPGVGITKGPGLSQSREAAKEKH